MLILAICLGVAAVMLLGGVMSVRSGGPSWLVRPPRPATPEELAHLRSVEAEAEQHGRMWS